MNVRLDLPDEVMDELVERITARVVERLEVPRQESEFLNVREAAEFLRCSRQRVYDLMSDGRLERHHEGSRVLVRRADLVAHVLPSGSRSRIGTGGAR